MVVKTSAVNALVRQNPVAAAALAPDHPRLIHRTAMREFRASGGVVSAPTLNALNRSLKRAPLAEEPLLLGGVQELAQRDAALAQRLLTEARRRNPRSRATRLLLLDRYLRTGQIEAAAAEIAVLSRLLPQANRVLIPELAKFASNSRTRPALARALQNDPALQQDLLRHMAESGSGPEVVTALAEATESPASRSAPNDWRGILVQKLVDRNEIGRAFGLWSSFLGTPATQPETGVYDGSFEGRPGSPPFNWYTTSAPAGVAERSGTRTLQVEYYGRLGADLAGQLLMLRPGRYRLLFQAEGDASGKGSRLSWALACVPSNAAVGDIPIRTASYAPQQMSGGFTVPASGCSAQWLRLIGTPAEFPATQSVAITNVRVEGTNR